MLQSNMHHVRDVAIFANVLKWFLIYFSNCVTFSFTHANHNLSKSALLSAQLLLSHPSRGFPGPR
jgi:hypothetical protein